MTIKSYSRGLSSWDRWVRGASGPTTCSPTPVFSTHEISFTSSSSASASDWSLFEQLDSLWFFFSFFFFDFFLHGKNMLPCSTTVSLCMANVFYCSIEWNFTPWCFNWHPIFCLNDTLTFCFSSSFSSFSSPLKIKQVKSLCNSFACFTSHNITCNNT